MPVAARVRHPLGSGAAVAHQLEFRGVSKSFVRRGAAQTVLNQVDLTLPAGAFVALTGASGSGKTTLLELAVGLQQPSAGTVRLGGVDLASLTEGRLAALRLEHVGLLFKDHALIHTLGAAHNVALPLLLAGAPSGPALRRAGELLERLGLVHLAAELPGELSQGERYRLGLARALVTAPALLVADEPTAGLDSVAVDDVMQLLAQQVDEQGLTVLLATHDARTAAYAERAYRLVGGRLERA